MRTTTQNGGQLTAEQRQLHGNRLRLIRAILFGGTVEDYADGDERPAEMPVFFGRAARRPEPAMAMATIEPARRTR